MLQEFSTIFVTGITFEQVATNLLFALLCGLAISWIYRLTYRGPGFAISFVHALIYLAMITAVVIMVIGLGMIMMAKSSAVLPMGRKFLLQFSLLGDKPDAVPYEIILKEYCRTHKLINVKSEEEENLYEISFYVDLRDEQKHYELVKELRRLPGMLRVNLFYDEEAI